ncbi:MAG: hypothetical protein MOB07_26160 [Acidobacteria bacterium]|nr:hypothetical protein [Acidobacteriota bacterium]
MKRRIPLKVQKLLVGYILAGLLAFWSIGAMWSHINGLQSQYGWMMKIGVLAGEFAVFVLITWHVLRRWVWTRVYCLVGATALAIAIIVHVAAVIKHDSNKVEGKEMIAALSEGQAKIASANTSAAIKAAGETAKELNAAGQRKTAASAIRTGKEVAATHSSDANKQFTEAATKIEQRKKADNFMSAEYLGGPMYAVIFCLALLIIGIGFGVMEFGSPYEDDDEDGIPNYAERDHRLYNPEQAADYWRGRRPESRAWPVEIDPGK